MVIQFSEEAANEVRDMMHEEESGVHLRFGVKGGGCNGLSYTLGFDYDINTELDTVENVKDIPVVMNTQDIPIIDGTMIDFKQNLMGGGFSIDNPNAVLSCGCGSSFKAKKREGSPEKC